MTKFARRSLSAFALALSLGALPALAADYVQAPGSALAFGGMYQGEAFSGRFPGFDTRLSFDPADPAAARLEVTIPMAGATTTTNPDYDGEMRGDAFLAVAKFPQARYTASGFRTLGDGRYAADGVLSLHGVEKPVTLTFTWTPGPQPVLAGKATVRRLDFGVGAGDWADTDLIPDEIAVSARVLFSPAAGNR